VLSVLTIEMLALLVIVTCTFQKLTSSGVETTVLLINLVILDTFNGLWSFKLGPGA
jgi:hypothetical protein